MNTPLAVWDNNDSSHPQLVWWTRLDQRWQVEVQRVNDYNATLCVFDHTHDNTLRHSEPVGLAYGAIMGPDVDDVRTWQESAIAFVDSLPT